MCCLPLSVANSPSFSAFNPASSYKVHIIGEDRHDEGPIDMPLVKIGMMRGPVDMPLVKRGMMRGPVDMPLVKIGMMRGWVYPHAEKTEGAKFIYPSNIHTIILHTYTTNNKNQEWKKLSSIRYSHASSAIGI